METETGLKSLKINGREAEIPRGGKLQQVQVSRIGDRVRITFARPTSWVQMPASAAFDFARAVMMHAEHRQDNPIALRLLTKPRLRWLASRVGSMVRVDWFESATVLDLTSGEAMTFAGDVLFQAEAVGGKL